MPENVKMNVKLLITTTVIMLLNSHTWAYPYYADLIPNGSNVPNPSIPDEIWRGVGHLAAGGGGPRNQFGLDFADAGREWTAELCNKDSDGDGLSNGKELGDPNCVWLAGEQPERTTGISHPGIKNEECEDE